ncbi:MAG TPA: hypothetical protein VFA89_16740 [Terriglobales bacterium]|nr:hypothetical protein [Terriglobales bacterium]
MVNRRSPTLEGFRAVFREPSLGCAEIAWRWTFGCAVLVLLSFSFIEFLDTLPVSDTDLLLLRTRHPSLASQAIAHILQGTAFRFLAAALMVTAGIGVAWAVVAALGRSAILKWLFDYFPLSPATAPAEIQAGRRSLHFGPLLALNLLRVAVAFLAAGACFGAFLVGDLTSAENNPQPAVPFVLAASALFLVWIFWSVLNWFFSVASIFVVRDGQTPLDALFSAVELCRERFAAVLVVGFWFGLAHLTAFSLATTAVAFPFALAGALPVGLVLSGVLLVTLGYFAIVDWLRAGRLAAYVAIIEAPPVSPLPMPAPLPPTRDLPGSTLDSSSALPRNSAISHWDGIPASDDDILSDIPPTA